MDGILDDGHGRPVHMGIGKNTHASVNHAILVGVMDVQLGKDACCITDRPNSTDVMVHTTTDPKVEVGVILTD